MKLQKRDGSFSSQQGEWDGTGQILCTVLDILFRFGTRKELKQWYGILRKGWLWIEKTRKKSYDSWVAPTVDFLCANNLIDGLFFQSIIHTGFNTYLSLQLARVLLCQGDERCHTILDAVIKLGGGVHAWPEAAHPISKGGCMGDGDHGWAAAEFINFVRSLFVMEEEGRLVFGKGLRKEWIDSGMPIAISEAISRFGTVSWCLQTKENEMHLEYSLKRSELQHPAPLLFCFPKRVGGIISLSPEELATASNEEGFHSFTLHRDEGSIMFRIAGDEIT